MKKYILMGQISGIGGWQLYMSARATYLKEIGVEVYVISIGDEKRYKITLDSFVKIKRACIPDLHSAPVTYTDKQKKRVIDSILLFIDYKVGDNVFIESTDITLSMWGEMLAKRTNGVNYSFLLHSHLENVSRDVQCFFEHKYRQNQIAGMSAFTLHDLFKGYMEIPIGDTREITASPGDPLSNDNPLNDVTETMMSFKQGGGRIIAYFGNLMKPHFPLVCQAVSDYVKKHNKDSFMFMTIGSSAHGKAENLQYKVVGGNPNCICTNVKALYPVPRKLLQETDVCIASWGCAIVASRARALTIRIMDDVNLVPHGIMGITLCGKDYLLSPPINSTFDNILDDILYKNKYKAEEIVPPIEIEDYSEYKRIQDSIMRPFDESWQPVEYYDIELIKRVNRRAVIEKLMHKILGIKTTLRIIELVKIVWVKNA